MTNQQTANTKKFSLSAQNSLFRNTVRLITGNLFIQVVSFLTLPVFSRIYLPSDYGIWGIFIFISGFLSVVFSLRYELSVMIPVSDNEAGILMRISKSIALMMFVLSSIIIILFAGSIAAFFKFSFDLKLILLVPVLAYFNSYNNIMSQWISRKKLFRKLNIIRIIQSVVNILVSYYLGAVLNLQYLGLVSATIISVFAGNCLITFITRKTFYSGFIFRFSFIKKYVLKYKNFLFYSTPLALLNFYTLNILNYFLQVNYGAVINGLYTNASRLVNTPLSLISSSFSAVFYQHFSRSENKRRVLLISFLSLLVIFTSLLLPIIIWGEDLISWYLGENWRESAHFIKLLSVVTIMSFTTGSISTIFAYLQKENVVLIWQIVYLLAVILIFTVFKNDYTNGMIYYSITGGIAYFLLFLIGLHYVKSRENT
jgi:O-antigen/teichoic acid export membrane protein